LFLNFDFFILIFNSFIVFSYLHEHYSKNHLLKKWSKDLKGVILLGNYFLTPNISLIPYTFHHNITFVNLTKIT